ncbi:MAG TPA: HAMP domain-containing sensor histidine kinase [Cyclobacteriaceae bacterium]|nr:HAMP domain-containing histidine kinase [Cyclobacteriaceae bacterium]HRE65706.1 HAMP domain-containing sensor histidine kinase [Cyclobacteriaceae bacterium]HRF32465.1 HAMP domain-containing sensor histidine kinase [Cyclobacteriaceae bacterium]
MRLLQVSLRSMLLYALVLVLVSIPVSLFSIREIINEEVDESLALHADQFARHIKNYEYLDDLDLDLRIWDQLSYDIVLEPSKGELTDKQYKTGSMYDSLEQEMHPFRALSLPVVIKGKPYLLTVYHSLVDNDELITALLIVQAILILLLVSGLLLLNRALSKKLWEPFYSTLEQLKAYELDKNETISTQKTNITEFDDLNKTVGHLTERNRQVFLQQKEFIENASHELQTPISIFQSKLDNLMQIQGLTEAGAATILDLEEAAQRMARLNKNLLLLSKIDNDQFNHAEEIDLSKLAEGLLSNLRPMADLDVISIESSFAPLSIKANLTLIEVLLTNLFHNAIRHTTPNGKVVVEIVDRKLIVSNTGNPLKMNPDKMFDRFSREGNGENSSGLGLAIVKKICDTSSFGLDYSFHSGIHTFSVLF